MAETNDFPNGIIAKEGNVDFVKARLSFKVDEFIKTLKDNEKKGWVNLDVLMSKQGKMYCKFNTYEPEATAESKATEEPIGDDLPF